MKKIISFLLCAVMLLIPLTAFAEDNEAEKPPMMGDCNFDGKVTASDARSALRISANLEDMGEITMLSIDADGDGKISAADARLILRKSAQLSEFTYGFDENGVANSIKAIQSDTFSLSVLYDDINMEIHKKGNNILIASSDFAIEMPSLGITDCGILFIGNDLYLTYTQTLQSGADADIAMFIDESLRDKMELSSEEIEEIITDVTKMLPSEFSAPQKEVDENGEVKYIYTVSENGTTNKITVDSYGIIKSISNVDSTGNANEVVTITSVSAEVPDSLFDLSRFEQI